MHHYPTTPRKLLQTVQQNVPRVIKMLKKVAPSSSRFESTKPEGLEAGAEWKEALLDMEKRSTIYYPSKYTHSQPNFFTSVSVHAVISCGPMHCHLPYCHLPLFSIFHLPFIACYLPSSICYLLLAICHFTLPFFHLPFAALPFIKC